MPDGFDIQVTGVTDLQAMLDELSTRGAERCIRTALKAGAEVERLAVAERAPVKPDIPGGKLPPGALKSDIAVRIRRLGDSVFEAVIGPGKLTAHVARWVEYGHRLVTGGRLSFKFGHQVGPGNVIGFVQRHPFIRPAFEATVEQAVDVTCKTLAAEIEATAAKKRTK